MSTPVPTEPAPAPIPIPIPSEARLGRYPKVTITYCTQCKWLLRAAYHAQELLSTFSDSLGEVALQPSTGGIYRIHIDTEVPDSTSLSPGVRTEGQDQDQATRPEHEHSSTSNGTPPSIRRVQLWDRKTQGGFPETKILKRLIRDVIEPERGLGHVDRVKSGKDAEAGEGDATAATAKSSTTSTNGDVIVGRDVSASDPAAAVHSQVNGTTSKAKQVGLNGSGQEEATAGAVEDKRKDQDDEDQCDCAKPQDDGPNI